MSNILVTSRLILDNCVVDYISSILGSTQIFINFSNASLIAPRFTSVLDNLEQIIFLSFIAFLQLMTYQEVRLYLANAV